MDATTIQRQIYFGDYKSEMIERIRLIAKKSNAKKRTKKIVEIVAFVLFLICLYTVIGVVSLLEISDGAKIAYSPFWHGPWVALANMLLSLGVS